ncbi:hypothetical protein EVA_03043 [gut metagenome]|uniref:Uncharacterized protein n=1 Tax=gut metagenome TaxID=749906 RepID=J9GLQ4_9ZZZZ
MCIRKLDGIIFFRCISHVIDTAIPDSFFINYHQLERQTISYTNRQSFSLEPFCLFIFVFYEHDYLHSSQHGSFQCKP